jgi:hypothetical protein
MNTSIRHCLALVAAGLPVAQAGEDLFPFVIPGLAAPPAGAVVDVAWLNDRPAGRHGPVRVRDGRFVDGRGQRLRVLASNVTFGSCFPDHATADRLAARMASLGLNCIRFHHADTLGWLTGRNSTYIRRCNLRIAYQLQRPLGRVKHLDQPGPVATPASWTGSTTSSPRSRSGASTPTSTSTSRATTGRARTSPTGWPATGSASSCCPTTARASTRSTTR